MHRTVLKLYNDIVASQIADFKRKVGDLISQDDVLIIEIDCSEVNFIDSIGIGALVALNEAMKKKGGEIIISNLSREIFDILQTMCLDNYLTIVNA